MPKLKIYAIDKSKNNNSDKSIPSLLLENHKEAPTVVTQKQIENYRGTEPNYSIEKQLETKRIDGDSMITEKRLNEAKNQFGVSHRNEKAYTGNINKLEEQRLSNKKKNEDGKYELASSTSKKLRWWEEKADLKIASCKECKIAQTWNNHEPQDLMEDNKDTDPDLSLEPQNTPELEAEQEPFVADKMLENNPDNLIDNEMIESEYDEVDDNGTPMAMGSVSFDTDKFDSNDAIIKKAIEFINAKHPGLNITEKSLDLSDLDMGEITYAISKGAPQSASPVLSSNLNFKITYS